MYHEIMTNKCKFKYDIKNRYSKTISNSNININLSPYKKDIHKIFETMMNDDTTYEYYSLYKDDFDNFINNIMNKIIIVNTPPVEIIYDDPLLIDKTIYIKPKGKTVIGLMKKI